MEIKQFPLIVPLQRAAGTPAGWRRVKKVDIPFDGEKEQLLATSTSLPAGEQILIEQLTARKGVLLIPESLANKQINISISVVTPNLPVVAPQPTVSQPLGQIAVAQVPVSEAINGSASGAQNSNGNQITPFCQPSPASPTNGVKRVLSIAIGDVSAWEVLAHLQALANQNGGAMPPYDVYTGSGWGAFISLLLALDIPLDEIKAAFAATDAKGGNILTKRPKGTRKFGHRNAFAPVLTFLNNLAPDVGRLTVGQLKHDIYIPVLNTTADIGGAVSRVDTPDLPVATAAACALAIFQDFEPLEVTKAQVMDGDGPLSQPGFLWSPLSIGFMVPDDEVARRYGIRNVAFHTFTRPVHSGKVKDADMSDFYKLNPHVKAGLIAYTKQMSNTLALMSEFMPSYQAVVLPEVAWQHVIAKDGAAAMLAMAPRTITFD